MNDFTGRIKRDEWRPPAGFRRTLTCALDTAQYQLDMDALAARRATEDVYASFNLLMRRKPKVRGLLALQILVPQPAKPPQTRMQASCCSEAASQRCDEPVGAELSGPVSCPARKRPSSIDRPKKMLDVLVDDDSVQNPGAQWWRWQHLLARL